MVVAYRCVETASGPTVQVVCGGEIVAAVSYSKSLGVVYHLLDRANYANDHRIGCPALGGHVCDGGPVPKATELIAPPDNKAEMYRFLENMFKKDK